MENWATAYAVDGNAVDQVCLPVGLPSAYRPGEKAQGIRLNGRKAEPADIDPDSARLVHWQQCYGPLWQLKLAFEKQHNR